MRIKKIKPICQFFILLFLFSCGKDENQLFIDEVFFDEKPTVPKVAITGEAANISANFADISCTVTREGGAEVTTRGVCWSTNEKPTILDSYIENGAGLGDYICTLTELNATTTYYARAFATNDFGTGYSNQISFTTPVQFTNGDAFFWMSQSASYVVTVYLEGAYVGKITHYYSSSTPDCGSYGCVTVNDLPAGLYHYTASNSLYNWDGYIQVNAGQCNRMRLNVSK